MLVDIVGHAIGNGWGNWEGEGGCREYKHYPSLKTTRARWRINHAALSVNIWSIPVYPNEQRYVKKLIGGCPEWHEDKR